MIDWAWRFEIFFRLAWKSEEARRRLTTTQRVLERLQDWNEKWRGCEKREIERRLSNIQPSRRSHQSSSQKPPEPSQLPLCYTHFITTITQYRSCTALLPLPPPPSRHNFTLFILLPCLRLTTRFFLMNLYENLSHLFLRRIWFDLPLLAWGRLHLYKTPSIRQDLSSLSSDLLKFTPHNEIVFYPELTSRLQQCKTDVKFFFAKNYQ